MHAIVRRYEGIDTKRTDELERKVDSNLLPSLTKLPGFGGFFLIEAGNGVMSSVNFFDTSAQADDDSRRSQLAARGEAGDHCPESAEDHGRRGHRAPDERSGSGVTARKIAQRTREARGGPLFLRSKARLGRRRPVGKDRSDDEDDRGDCDRQEGQPPPIARAPQESKREGASGDRKRSRRAR